jgi:hypothetical protein
MATAPGTGLAVFDPKAGAPAHVAHFFDDAGTNIAPRTTVPSLSPEGKTWTISLNGQKTKLQRRNTDGDLEPLPIFKARHPRLRQAARPRLLRGRVRPRQGQRAGVLVRRRCGAGREPAGSVRRWHRSRAGILAQDQRERAPTARWR